MFVLLKKNISSSQKKIIENTFEKEGISFIETSIDGTPVLSVDDAKANEIQFDLANFEGVSKVVSTKPEYEKVSRKTKPSSTVIKVGSLEFSDQNFLMIAGPCSIENIDQAYDIAKNVKEAGAHILRGGAYKPRTSPYSFQGLGQDGLGILAQIKKDLNIPVITELMDTRDFDKVHEVADILQIGTRNMQNFSLLKELGKTEKPVLLKRGIAATMKEWLLSAEYILNAGNPNVILCERGIRSFDPETRNLLDLASVALAKQLSHLPVMVDPSHALGRRDLIEPMSLAALSCGANALMIEVHDEPHKALSDGAQALSYLQFNNLMERLKKLSFAFDKRMP